MPTDWPDSSEKNGRRAGITFLTLNSFELSREIEEQVRDEDADLSAESREAYLVELYRQERITHHQLAEALGLSRIETDGVLKRHKVASGPTLEEIRAEIGSLRDARPE